MTGYPRVPHAPDAVRDARGRCACSLCRARHAEGCRKARRKHSRMVPAGPSRKHLQHASRIGIGGRALSEASGVSVSTIEAIRNGKVSVVFRETEAKILAVKLDPMVKALPGARVSPTRTRREISDLLRSGWTKLMLATYLAGDEPTSRPNGHGITRLLGRASIRASTARAVHALWLDEVRDGAIIFEAFAPDADPVAAERLAGGERVPGAKPDDRRLAAAMLYQSGCSLNVIAKRLAMGHERVAVVVGEWLGSERNGAVA